jgi:hypothetical protein
VIIDPTGHRVDDPSQTSAFDPPYDETLDQDLCDMPDDVEESPADDSPPWWE